MKVPARSIQNFYHYSNKNITKISLKLTVSFAILTVMVENDHLDESYFYLSIEIALSDVVNYWHKKR
jgi:arginine/ornithine N-succinyltransferase beta subunit